jgi:hypothetical protein
LSYEPDFVLESRRREALTVGVSRDERLSFLDQYYDVLGGLEHFVRDADNEESANQRMHARRASHPG